MAVIRTSRRLVFLAAICGLLLSAAPAVATNTSTADPTYPASFADIDSEPLRQQFNDLINDIDNLWAAIGPNFLEANQVLGAIISGKATALSVPSCFSPTNALTWRPGLGYGCNDIASSGGGGSLSPAPAFTVLAGPAGGPPAIPTAIALTPNYLPLPSSNSIGGVESIAPVAHEFMTGISTSGVPQLGTPGFSDITGIIGAAQLPTPSPSSIGGTQSIAVIAHNFVTGISTLGVPTQAQPSFNDISGNISVSQMASGAGASASTFWRGDGAWVAVSGGGSVNVTAASPNVIVNPSPGTGAFTIGITAPIVNLGVAINTTIVANHMGKILVHTGSAAMSDSLAQAGSSNFGAGAAFTELNLGSAALTITSTGGSTINGSSSLTLPACSTPPTCPWADLISDGINYEALVY
jgi:hypothetical protein